ncbi:MAG: DUF6132 family protein [Ignavibacteriaceae bacterium]
MFKTFKNLTTKKKALVIVKIALPLFIGAMGGYAYYYYVGCVSGTCPITSNPFISTAYGAGVGALFINWKGKSKKED